MPEEDIRAEQGGMQYEENDGNVINGRNGFIIGGLRQRFVRECSGGEQQPAVRR